MPTVSNSWLKGIPIIGELVDQNTFESGNHVGTTFFSVGLPRPL